MNPVTQAASGLSHYSGQDLEALADMPHYYSWILETFWPYLRGRVLEVGAGTGNFAAHYVDRVQEAVLVEPAKNLFPRLVERFAGKAHVFPVCGLLDEVSRRPGNDPSFASGSFDATILVNVLEHIPDDHATCVRLAQLLRPGGALLLFVPALPWLYGSLDVLLGHHRRYSRSRLARTLARAHFDVLCLHYFDVLGIMPWLAAGRILHQNRLNPLATQTYDRVVVPLAAALERRLTPRIGKNLICVARSQNVEEAGFRRAA